MIEITNTNSTEQLYQFGCFQEKGQMMTSGRSENFPDVKICKRPNFSPCKFIDAVGRSGRSGRLYGVSCTGGKHTCIYVYTDSYGNTSGRPDVREVIQSLASTTQDRKRP